MGLFDRFKKKQTAYDPTNLSVRDLDRNFVFDYDLSTWRVLEVYEYDWGNEYFSKEYKVTNGTETRYLSIEEDDELEIALTKKIKPAAIQSDLPGIIRDKERPPDTLVFDKVVFSLSAERPGYFHNAASDEEDWEELISWDYYSDDGTKVLCIEQWDDFEFDAAVGHMVKEFEISNILPAD